MFARRVGAICALLGVVYVLFGAAPYVQAEDEPAGDRRRQECQEAKDERDAICLGLPTQEAQQTCWRSSLEMHEKCAPAAPLLDPSKHVVCRKKAWGVDCMITCAQEGIACYAGWKHPKKPEIGMGVLFKCAGSSDDRQCSYIYDNADECTLFRDRNDFYLCKYKGGE